MKEAKAFEQFPIEHINDRFVRLFRLTLSNALRKVVDIHVRSTEVIPFGELLETLSIPSSLNLFRMNPLHGNAIMIMEPPLVFTLIDQFFGGTGELEVKAEGRDFTEIEQRMIKRVIMSALEDLQKAWQSVFPIQISYQRNEVNPMFVAIVPSNYPVIVAIFDVEIGRTPMPITLCIPYSMIEPLIFFHKASKIFSLPLTKVWGGIIRIGYHRTPIPLWFGRITSQLSKITGINASSSSQFSSSLSQEPHRQEQPATATTVGNTLSFLKGIDPKIIASYISHEHPQTISLIMAHLPDLEQASMVFRDLPKNLQADVIYRMASLQSIPPGIIREMDDVLSEEMKTAAVVGSKVRGVESATEILNSLDQASKTRILAAIEESNPELAKAIK